MRDHCMGVDGTGQQPAPSGTPALLRPLREALREDPSVVVVDASRELYERGVGLYAERQDKEWSLTDCISFVVMNDQGISEALTTDRHFRQAGFRGVMLWATVRCVPRCCTRPARSGHWVQDEHPCKP